MLARLILATVILTNPICCQVFGSVEAVRIEEPASACDGCACQGGEGARRVPSSDEGKAPPRPCECPNCELCQCVCAGAIVKAAVAVDDSQGRFAVDIIQELFVEASSILLTPTHLRAPQMPCGEANVGRAARIRHASLLC